MDVYGIPHRCFGGSNVPGKSNGIQFESQLMIEPNVSLGSRNLGGIKIWHRAGLGGVPVFYLMLSPTCPLKYCKTMTWVLSMSALDDKGSPPALDIYNISISFWLIRTEFKY